VQDVAQRGSSGLKRGPESAAGLVYALIACGRRRSGAEYRRVSDTAPQHGSQDTLVRRAYAFAEAAHRGQRRKDDRAFIAHPVHVARLLAARGYDEEVVAAALLHDVVEDTAVTLAEIREQFGARVAQLVECVTENPELPTPERKRAYREGLRHSPDAARAICAADKVCNASDLYQAASQGEEQVLARFAGGLDAQVQRLSAELTMLDESGTDRSLRDAMRAELGGLRTQARRRADTRRRPRPRRTY
jgi:guanosine-3',5'-bis(diphosphate) 3'-pyrophosphohydrolase